MFTWQPIKSVDGQKDVKLAGDHQRINGCQVVKSHDFYCKLITIQLNDQQVF